MPKYKVQFEWYASMRGYDEVIVEAENAEKAKEFYRDEITMDYNSHCKIIDCDRDVYEVTEVTE